MFQTPNRGGKRPADTAARDAVPAMTPAAMLRGWVALALLLFATVGAAAHRHPDDGLVPRHAGVELTAANADFCPLCVAMHAAAPAVAARIAPAAVRSVVFEAGEEYLAATQQRHPPFYSRPPPAQSLSI